MNDITKGPGDIHIAPDLPDGRDNDEVIARVVKKLNASFDLEAFVEAMYDLRPLIRDAWLASQNVPAMKNGMEWLNRLDTMVDAEHELMDREEQDASDEARYGGGE